jgi:alanine racemase
MREALIRPAAISHNVEILRAMAGTENFLVVVKANGYGHGALTAARAALDGGANWLGTADIAEALELRHGGITSKILSWLYGPDEDLSSAYQNDVDLGVSSVAQLEQVTAVVSKAKPQRIHLKIDTGLGRNGADPRDWEELFRATKQATDNGLVVPVGLFTHLSGTSTQADAEQGQVFDDGYAMAGSLGVGFEIRHVASSIGTSDSPDLAKDMVRVGAACYGVPVTQRYQGVGLKPAMRVSGQVILAKQVSAGQGVGYGHTYRTETDTTLALVPLGYADGIPRHASSKGPVVIGSERFTVSGRISMDQFSVDVGGALVRTGDWAVLWGDPAEGHPSANEWADAAGTIAYEIITRLGSRIPRVVER